MHPYSAGTVCAPTQCGFFGTLIHCLDDKSKCQQIVKFLHYVKNISLFFFVSDCSIHTIRFHFILRIQEGSFVVCISVNELHFKSVIASHKIVGKKIEK